MAGVLTVAALAVSKVPFPKPTSRKLTMIMVVWAGMVGICIVAWGTGIPGGGAWIKFAAGSELTVAALIPFVVLKMRRKMKAAGMIVPHARRPMPRPRRRATRRRNDERALTRR
jgi:hypothetical protein